MLKLKFILSVLSVIIMSFCNSCSDDEPTNEVNTPVDKAEEVNLRAEISNIYWIVKDTKFIVDEKEYTPLEAMDMHIMPIGMSLLNGLYISDNTFRYYKSSLQMLYGTQDVIEEKGNSFIFNEYASYPEITILDYNEDCLTIQYIQPIGDNNAVIRATMTKANDEEIASFEQAVNFDDLFT